MRSSLAPALLLLAASTCRGEEDPLRLAFEWRVAGGLSAAATCALNAPPSEGGPTGGVLRLELPPGAEVQAALLYWTVLSARDPVPSGMPTIDGVPIAVEPVSQIEATPCFEAHPRTAAFRADVSAMVRGSGAFQLGGLPFEDGVTFAEGATLFVVACAPGGRATRVMLWDGLDVTRDSDPARPPFRQSLSGFVASASGPVPARLVVAAGNGQGREPPEPDPDPFFFNGIDLDAADRSLLSGAACPPLGLYDLTSLDLTGRIEPGATSAQLEIRSTGDCHSIAAVALAVAVDEPVPGGGIEPSALDSRPGCEPLRVTKARASGRIRLTWEDSGAPYDVLEGSLAALYDHGPVACAVGAPELEIVSSSPGAYFLVGGFGCSEGESSVGRSSFGVERPGPREASGRSCR